MINIPHNQNLLRGQALKKIKLSDKPGVYLFKKNKDILYIGKATSLKDRIKSYFFSDLISTRGSLIVDMVFQADKIDFIKTGSVLEALILENNLIKKYQPKYNTKEKDDKSYNYVVITKEDFPRVLIERGRNLFGGKRSNLRNSKRFDLEEPIQAIFGPFTNGGQLITALKIVRKIFPFRDKCIPCVRLDSLQATSYKLPICRPCFNKQIGLCPGVCDGSISKNEYAKIIKNIKLFFEGKKTVILEKLEKEMLAFAKNKEFEKADKIKKTIFALNHIQDVALLKSEKLTANSLHLPAVATVLQAGLKANFRIEGYDVAHLSGTNNVGVMVVMEGDEFNKNEYRKFSARGGSAFGGKTTLGDNKPNDIANLREILTRRFKHTEWQLPNLIVVDGGKAQMKTALNVVNDIDVVDAERPRVVSVVKNEKHKPRAILGDKGFAQKYEKEILLINNEAHRFAIKYHRQKRKKW